MTIVNIAPQVRVEPSPDTILSGSPVSSIAHFAPIVSGLNWLNGFGAMLVPGATGDSAKNEIAGGSTGTFHFRAYTRKQALERIWTFTLVGRTTESGASATISVNGGTSQSYSVSPSAELAIPVTYREVLSSQAAAVTDLSVAISAVGKFVKVVSISCWEQWRPQLDSDADDHGVNFQSIRPGQRVYVASAPTVIESVGGAAYALAQCDPRRVGVYHWSAPTTNPATRVGAYVNLQGLAMPVLTRQITNGQTKGTVYWSAYAKVSGSSGDVKLTTSHSGSTSTVNLVNTSYAWTTDTAIDIDCEDMSAADGRRGSSWDELTVQIRGNGGATISVAAVSVWEQP